MTNNFTYQSWFFWYFAHFQAIGGSKDDSIEEEKLNLF